MFSNNRIFFQVLVGFTAVVWFFPQHCVVADGPKPPQAKRKPHRLEKHGDVRIDPYYWLRERKNLAVLKYLRDENAYTEAMMKKDEPLAKKLFEEAKARIKQDDASAPYRKDGFWYYTRFEEGQQYPVYCRSKDKDRSEEEVLLNVNALAKGKKFCSVRGTQVSFERNRLAFAVDYVGRRKYTLRFKDLETGKLLPDAIPNVTGNYAWANDNRTIFYTRQDPETLRSFQVYRHELGTKPSGDKLVYEEKDPTFRCFVFKTRSDRFVMIGCDQSVSTEYRFLEASKPQGTFRVIQPRERNLEYSVEHLGDHFFIRTNWKAKNFRLMKAPVKSPEKTNWKEVVPHRKSVFLQQAMPFESFLVLQERRDGLTHIRIQSWKSKKSHDLDFGEPAYAARLGMNPETNTKVLRFNYTSLTTPSSVYDYDMRTRKKNLVKRTPVLGGFDPKNYVTDRLWATARDGTKVPVSLVYRKGTKIDGSAPLLLYGYGSYGASREPTFLSTRLNLLDRGFVYAIAHIRGGQEMGRQWYENGKLLKKKNTFTDFIDVAEHLIKHKYADPKRIFARGGSAGGLLMGAVLNMRPDLFTGVVADVPFVDVVTTMLDDTIPLTTSEYDEWGNPNVKKYYDYMLSYSPYDNVRKTDYPHILVTTGLHDSQVQYWEPAKWVARLRYRKTDDRMLLLKTNMAAGHGGASGRFERLREVAFRQAFLLRIAGIRE
ncbi:MAG: S9 family peptidase [Gemmataceae bacterium]